MLFIIAIILDLVLLGIYCIFFLYFLNKIRDKDTEIENPFYKPYAFFFLFVFIAEILYFSLLITSPVEYRYLYWNNPNIVIKILYRLQLMIKGIGYSAIVYTIEKNFFKDKNPLLTIIFLIIMTTGQLLLIFTTEEVSLVVSLFNVLMLGATFFIPIGYIYIGIKSSGPIRTKGLLIGIAFLLLLTATMMMTYIFLEVWGVKEIVDLNIMFIITVSMRICGSCIIFWGFK